MRRTFRRALETVSALHRTHLPFVPPVPLLKVLWLRSVPFANRPALMAPLLVFPGRPGLSGLRPDAVEHPDDALPFKRQTQTKSASAVDRQRVPFGYRTSVPFRAIPHYCVPLCSVLFNSPPLSPPAFRFNYIKQTGD